MQGLHRYGIKLGNERFGALLERLGCPDRAGFGIAHVAGTKGKGSTTAMIAAILRRHGFRVGGYYSPYVYDVRERVQVNGEMISRADFARLVTQIKPHADRFRATEHGSITEFELKTALGLCYFREQAVDFAAIEVGLGGRLDATNVVRPGSTVITNIGLDHTHILGDTLAQIASEKAGIIKPGVPCVTAADDPAALEVIRYIARERAAPLLIAGAETEQSRFDVAWSRGGQTFDVRTPRTLYAGLVSGLQGEYQRANAACAIAAVEALSSLQGFRVSKEAVAGGLAALRMPGRFEILRERPLVVLDGAHNGMAAEALAGEVAKLTYRRLIVVVGMVQGHEPDGVIAPFAPLASRFIATEPTWTKRQPAERIAESARRFGLEATISRPPDAALEAALSEAGPEDVVLVTGSFYTVGDVRHDVYS